jgi:hypothetical protein
MRLLPSLFWRWCEQGLTLNVAGEWRVESGVPSSWAHLFRRLLLVPVSRPSCYSWPIYDPGHNNTFLHCCTCVAERATDSRQSPTSPVTTSLPMETSNFKMGHLNAIVVTKRSIQASLILGCRSHAMYK